MRIVAVAVFLALTLTAHLAAGGRRVQGPLPTGFEDLVVVDTLSAPTAIAFAPDDRLFICEKNGKVRVCKNGQLLATPFVQLSVSSFSERGLLGIAFDPQFDTNRFIYVYYTTGTNSLNPPPSPKNRVSRLTANGDVAVPGSEEIVLDNVPSDAGIHNGGCLRFGADGKLYVSTGDGGSNPNNSQNLNTLAGKLLRLNRDGTIPADNPFVGQAGRRGEIYCYGLRNPWRFCFRPGTNTPYIADVGQNTWEEVNVGQAGGNFGWPVHEGPSSAAGFISPMYAYRHSGGASITGGCFITSTNYPESLRGSYFFGDYVTDEVRRLQVTAANTLQGHFDFANGSGPVDFAEGPEGDLYYLSIKEGTVRRFRYNGGQNRAPTARSSAAPLAGPLPLNVQFSSAGSSDPDGDSLSFLWDFGNGQTSTEPDPAATYQQGGDFTVSLRVSDGRGGSTDSAPLVIRAGRNLPAVQVTAPGDETLYNAGDLIGFSGGAIDAEEGALPPENLKWTVVFHHGGHTHPFMEFDSVADGSFTIPRIGEPSADTWYEIRLTATDSDGLKGESVVQIRPRKVALRFLTRPRGLDVAVDGQRRRTPFDIESVVGFDHLVDAPNQKRRGATYAWRSWSDGESREHTIRAPAAAATYTATFTRKR